jgi:serine/threonine protein kinase
VDSRKKPQNDSQSELFAGRFEILAHLGTGLVGEVYRARDTQDPDDKDGGVALKILRPGQDSSLIKSEALTLQSLWQEEEKLKDGFHAAPRLVVADPGAEEPFLAMEFIRGKQVPEPLRESEARHFDEPTALNVAMQLFRLLSIIHEGLNKTYIDLKMENLWWQAENGGRLRVTDWNVLEERHPIAAGKIDPVSIDIFRASISLYWMLTGELPDLQGNLKVRKLQRASNWDELSDGTKKLLSGLFLHKFETALQAQRELERLLQYWNMDAVSLVSKAREFVSNDAEKASEIVSILRKRNTQPDKDFNALENVLKETWSQRDDPTKSISLFSAGSYSTALVLIENAYPHTSQPHVFRWWQQAVELTSKLESSIKKSMPDSNSDEKVERIRGIVVKSVNAYFGQKYADAKDYFRKMTLDLPDEQGIKRSYEELLDVLMGLQFNEQAENQREQANDEDAEARRGLYKKAMEDYKQARSKVLTVSPALLPEAISTTTLEDSINELQNETKVLSRAAKGKQYFKEQQIELALDAWREGFRLDPDHPELMDFVLSAASERLAKGALDEASMLLDIIPMSGYSFACDALRKKINDARQKQVEQNELPGNSEASSEEQAPLDILKYEEADVDMTLAQSAKSPDLVLSQKKAGPTNARVLNDIAPVKKVRPKSQTSDHGKSVPRISTTKTDNNKSVPKSTDKNKTPHFIQTTPSHSYLEQQGSLMDIDKEINKDDREGNLTIGRLNNYVMKIGEILDANQDDFPEDRKRLSDKQEKLRTANILFKELGLDVLNKNREKDAPLNTSFLQLLQGLQKQYQNDPVFMNYINLEMENFKKNVVKKTLDDDTFRHPMLIKMMMDVWTDDDPDVSRAFDKLKAIVLQEKPSGWRGIDYYQKLARINPAKCRRELDVIIKTPFVFLGYYKQVQEIEKQIKELEQIGITPALERAYSFGPPDIYRNEMQTVISRYKLNWQLDDCVEWFKEVKLKNA